MSNFARIVLLAFAWLLPTMVAGHECDGLKSASIEQAEHYLNYAADDARSAECVQIAFRQIASSPVEEAIPTLLKYLSYKRPLNEGESRGIFMHGKNPETLYPAVHELYHLGNAAEPSLVNFIATGGGNARGMGLENAVYTLLLIHHGNVIAVIQQLHNESNASPDAAKRDRLQAAARSAMKWCDNQWQSKCEDALNQ